MINFQFLFLLLDIKAFAYVMFVARGKKIVMHSKYFE